MREATFLVLVYLHTQSSVKIMLRLWSDRRYERFGKCFLAFGEGGKTMKMFIYQSQSGDRREGVASPFFSILPCFFPFPSLLFPPSPSSLLLSPPPFFLPPHHCLITTVKGSSPRYVEVWTWNRYRDFLASSWLDRVVWSSIHWRQQNMLLSMNFETSEAIGSTPKCCDLIYPLDWKLGVFLCLPSWCCRTSNMCRVPSWSNVYFNDTYLLYPSYIWCICSRQGRIIFPKPVTSSAA